MQALIAASAFAVAIVILCLFREFRPFYDLENDKHGGEHTSELSDIEIRHEKEQESLTAGISTGDEYGSAEPSEASAPAATARATSKAAVQVGLHHTIEADFCQSGLQLAIVAIAFAVFSVALVIVAVATQVLLKRRRRRFRRSGRCCPFCSGENGHKREAQSNPGSSHYEGALDAAAALALAEDEPPSTARGGTRGVVLL
jgi:hypothetical protein